MTKKPADPTPAPTKAQLGQRIRALRLARQMNAAELDRHLDARPGTVAGIESGKRQLFAGELYRLALAMGVPIASFFPEEYPVAQTDLPDHNTVDPKEARAFAAAYQNLKDPKVRRRISALTKAMAARKPRP